MITGREITAKVKALLKEANSTGRNLYCASSFPKGNPMRIIGVSTEHGLTIARTITGGNFPVSNVNLDKLYIQ